MTGTWFLGRSESRATVGVALGEEAGSVSQLVARNYPLARAVVSARLVGIG
ncbi:MAG: hypothetical protein ACE5NA_12910 [Nitrospiraceae bacterium]